MRFVRHARFVVAGLFALFMREPARAQAAGSPGLLVTAKWVNAHLQDKNLVILVIGPDKAYSTGHIPGARSIGMMDILVRPPADSDSKMLPEPALKEMLGRKFGISDQSQVVVVSDSGWYSAATRVMLTLQYAGLGERSSLLDGGASAWRKAGYPVSTDAPSPVASVSLSAAPVAAGLVVNHAYVTAHARAPKTRLIDAREAACFAGSCEPGHIPGATSLPMEALFDDAGFFKSKTDLEALFRGAGVQAGDTVVAYCHNGFRSTAVVFAARLLGYPVKNYDGSMRDWMQRKLPVEGG